MTDHSQPRNETPTSPSVDGNQLQNAAREQLMILDHWGSGENQMHCGPAVFRNAAFVMRKLAAALSRSEAPAAGWVAKHRDGDLGSALSRTQQDAVSLLMRSGIAGNHGWGVIPLYAAPSPDTRVREAEND